ncbi:putative amidohydrolase [Rhodothalassium salexigens DSM 2132]|uniref:Putative amidohydrolase n=1 Tax=Rhodothalassium salexigens DSM 2132 TaxID=1188247 RepID=A0A4R2PPI7_RHOSA|nr:carbon-nitrogen hydrolase family protein [Rhodothalassium salexigens]MBB4210781.1 putative amidohydrolase/GNAT superfamily N-acetyltransferase [Rhodothalassium salexigens DSM 2132]MBK1639115.1 carbon-nitrogen hydrolase [Rhodothalassium salexigens DSM 2132]TCP37663.1 putative amidohydrolase [Rhodothalassium salexigens DSM 2132]
MAAQQYRAKIHVREATPEDVPAIHRLLRKAYNNDDMMAETPEALRGALNRFPQGQFVALWEDRVVGYCSTFVIRSEVALRAHTYAEITGNGFAARHDPRGDMLYGMEVAVDPDMRSKRIGQRLYNARKELCERLGLKGIAFGGRMPGLARRLRKVGSVEAYVEAVQKRQIRDSVLHFQLRNGFEFQRVLPNYLPSDRQSMGYAALMVWHNPNVPDESVVRTMPKDPTLERAVRVCTVQLKMRAVSSFSEFIANVEYFTEVASDYEADFVVFPELFTLQLLSAEPRKLSPADSIEALTNYTERFRDQMRDLAVAHNINIVGGSHPTKVANGEVRNVAYLFGRDGAVHAQEKIHPTPNEAFWWNITGGDRLSAIQTDCGPVGILICYDTEFPELARHLVDQGAVILFTPFCTDERQSYLRVRYCAQARAVENQCYVVLSGNVGNLPNVENMDIQYAQSCILNPCDFPFARDGIAADTTPNAEMVAFADLHLDALMRARNDGTVQNLKDRRFDLYSVNWKKPLPEDEESDAAAGD